MVQRNGSRLRRLSADAHSRHSSGALHLARPRRPGLRPPPEVTVPFALASPPCFASLPHGSGASGVVGLVAPAGSGFQTAAVEDRDIPAAVADQFAIFSERWPPRSPRPDALPAWRRGFVRAMKGVRVRPVLSHQEATGETLFDDMKARAGGSLRELAHPHVEVALKHPLQRRTESELAAKRRRVHSKCKASALDQGNIARRRKEGGANALAGFGQNLCEGQLDRRAAGQKAPPVLVRGRASIRRLVAAAARAIGTSSLPIRRIQSSSRQAEKSCCDPGVRRGPRANNYARTNTS